MQAVVRHHTSTTRNYYLTKMLDLSRRANLFMQKNFEEITLNNIT